MSKLNKLEEEGGPAFPFTKKAYSLDYPGMTVRDYFAAQALPGLVQRAALGEYNHAGIAELAYELADAMVVERSKS